VAWLRDWLSHPLTRGLNLDDPRTTLLRRDIIRRKRFLRQIYEEWYATIVDALPNGDQPVLELGSGAGFLADSIPGLITSEISFCVGTKLAADGQHLPIADNTLRGIVMTNVLHHLPNVRLFFREASRCVQAGGVIVMLEPWVTSWSSLIYRQLHHEPYYPEAAQWEFPAGGPLSAANDALAWIVFQRDREQFRRDFPQLRIVRIRLCMPFRYLVCGGLSMRDLVPIWTFGWWRAIEDALKPWMNHWAMFAHVVLQRV
jgi:SAM-dependent methyltransferase